MTPQHLEGIADDELLDAVRRAAASERDATVELLALLGEVDVRKLYLGQGCASLFTYCTQVLHLSEHAAYHRIEGARAARQFPRVLDLLSSGALTLTTVGLLRQILTADNANEVLEAAAFKSKREVEVLVAGLAPKPDVPTVVRRIPGVATLPLQCGAAPPTNCQPGPADTPHGETAVGDGWVVPRSTTSPRPVASPLSRDRFLLRVTISADTHAKLRRAQDLLRHSIPSGDPAAVIGRALTMLVDHLERAKTGQARRSRPPKSDTAPPVNTRHIPRAVRRAVGSAMRADARSQVRTADAAKQPGWNSTTLWRSREADRLKWPISPCAAVRTTSSRRCASSDRVHANRANRPSRFRYERAIRPDITSSVRIERGQFVLGPDRASAHRTRHPCPAG